MQMGDYFVCEIIFKIATLLVINSYFKCKYKHFPNIQLYLSPKDKYFYTVLIIFFQRQ